MLRLTLRRDDMIEMLFQPPDGAEPVKIQLCALERNGRGLDVAIIADKEAVNVKHFTHCAGNVAAAHRAKAQAARQQKQAHQVRSAKV